MKYLRFLALTLLIIFGYTNSKAQIFWGYSDNTVAAGISMGQNSLASGAIYIPSEVAELYKGKNAAAIRIGLSNAVTNLKIFITEDLNGNPQTETEIGSANAGTISFNFDEPYVINGKGFYVGYSCNGTSSIGRSNIYNSNGCWLKDNDGEWIDYAGNEEFKFNALNIAVRIDGDDMPIDARLIVNNETFVNLGEDIRFKAKLENLSTKSIKKYKIEYNIDNGEKETIEKTTYIASGSTTTINIDIPSFNEYGVHTLNMNLISIDGNEDAYAGNNNVVAYIKITEDNFVKRMVVEEGTGTWCGWCPKGIVAFEYMHEKYPDTFIGIAAHTGDVFAEDTYAPIQDYFTGYPRCIVNRDPTKIYDPTSTTLEVAYKNISQEQAPANIQTQASLDGNTIYAKATTTFANSNKNLDYRIAFVVLEDSIVGYEQTNNYSGGGNGAMGGFEDLPKYVPIKFNHVARGIYDYNGIENSIPTDVVKGEYYEFEKEIELPEVQRTKYLSIVALLINGKTGLIDNAAKAHITQAGGIENAEDANEILIYATPDGTIVCSEENGELEVYNIEGFKVPNYGLSHGLYIVKYISESGITTTKKIII